MKKASLIKDYFDELFPNAKAELNYNKDYELLIAVMLSAQTTDKRVNIVTKELFTKYDSLLKLSQASFIDVTEIVKSLGNYQRKGKAIVYIARELIAKHDGLVPNDRSALENLPSVGRKTANVVLSNLFKEPVMAVDTHVDRVSKRLGIASFDDNLITVENNIYKLFLKKDILKLHHQFVLFGRYHCKAIKPLCDGCKLKVICKYRKDD